MPLQTSSDSHVPKIALIAIAACVLALFGADLSQDEEIGYQEWRREQQEARKRGWLPWSPRRAKRHKLDDLQEARMRLTDERRRRAESEESLSLARTRLGETLVENEALQSRIETLELHIAEQSRQILDLQTEAGRAEIASPELVQQFIDLAEAAVSGARFDTALGLLADADAMLEVLEAPSQPQQIARLELIRATASVALGREDAAAESLGRLLDVAPDFAIDSARSPPKVLRVLERVRTARGVIAREDAPRGGPSSL